MTQVGSTASRRRRRVWDTVACGSPANEVEMNTRPVRCSPARIERSRASQLRRGRTLAGLLAGLLACAVARAQAPGPAGPGSPPGPAMMAAMEQALVETIARAERSVVAIARVRRQRPGETFSLELRPDPFGRPALPAAPPQPTDPDFIPTEYASGVIVDARGLVLTACHVLGEQSDYYITTHDRRVYRAQVKGADPRSDLAVLAFEAASGLQAIRLGDATQLRKGQIVVALGNPYAIARDGQVSASWGIVANLSRKAPPLAQAGAASARPTLHHFGTLIQTDAKLNLGTSGGPLLNLRGEMVGLSVALAAVSGYQSAAGYAIPVDQTFRRVVDTLKQGREVEYGFLGVQPVDLPLSRRLAGLQGLRVERVVPGTPAARCGLRTDDVIVAVDGRPVPDADALMLQVGRLLVESRVDLDVVRQGRTRRLEAVLAKYPVQGYQVVTNPRAPWRGMRVDYPTAVLDAQGRFPGGMAFPETGIVVTEVEPDTPAWQAGIRPGVVISRVGRTAVDTPRQFDAAVAGQPGAVSLVVLERGEEQTRTIPPES